MAKVNKGILDGYIGKVGTVIGYFVHGKAIMRSASKSFTDANTQKQQLVRTRFGALSALQSGFMPAVNMGMSRLARQQRNTPANCFVSRNWNAVSAFTPGEAEVDYSKIVVAEGNLPSVVFSAPSFEESLSVGATFVGNTDMGKATEIDDVYLFLYAPSTGQGMLGVPAHRSDQRIIVGVPSNWSGMKVHIYGFAVGRGAENGGLVSHSSYLGSGTIA
ncbi:MAG: hypothetical protein IJ761_00770 [Bacteroidales bacterium]|nr:hypothetical protein [Bacteroidales bacterium]